MGKVRTPFTGLSRHIGVLSNLEQHSDGGYAIISSKAHQDIYTSLHASGVKFSAPPGVLVETTRVRGAAPQSFAGLPKSGEGFQVCKDTTNRLIIQN